MELRQIAAAAANGTQSEQTPVRPGACPGGCGLCCGVARLAGSGSVHGLVAADTEGGRRLYDPRCWSWEQLRQLIVSPTQAGFHVVHVPIRDNGEIPAANGSFDIAVLGLVPTAGMLDTVVQSLVRCVRPGGLLAAVQPRFTACQPERARTPRMAASDVARCVELLRKHGCRNISILSDSDPLCPMKDPCNRSGTDCRGVGRYKSAHLSAVVAQVGVSERKRTL